MLRFYNGSHDVTIPTDLEPPRPVVLPRARNLARPPRAAMAVATQVDSGIAPARQLRFVSGETQGLIEWATVDALLAMYEDGGAFKVDTDLVGPPGSVTRTFDCLWDEGASPVFTPVANGQRWLMDLVVRAMEE